MVTVSKKTGDAGTVDYEFKGLSGDTKPVGKFGAAADENGNEVGGCSIAVNSVFLELDTLDLYYYTGSGWTKAGG